MAAGRFDVPQRTSTLGLDFVLTKLPDRAGGHPHGEHSRRNRRPWGHDSTGSDPGVLANLCAIENDRSDPDQRTVRNAAAMHDRAMSDRNLVTQESWIAIRRDMQSRLVLDIGSLSDANPFDIAPKD
jgi:hypothetical protein